MHPASAQPQTDRQLRDQALESFLAVYYQAIDQGGGPVHHDSAVSALSSSFLASQRLIPLHKNTKKLMRGYVSDGNMSCAVSHHDRTVVEKNLNMIAIGLADDFFGCLIEEYTQNSDKKSDHIFQLLLDNIDYPNIKRGFVEICSPGVQDNSCHSSQEGLKDESFLIACINSEWILQGKSEESRRVTTQAVSVLLELKELSDGAVESIANLLRKDRLKVEGFSDKQQAKILRLLQKEPSQEESDWLKDRLLAIGKLTTADSRKLLINNLVTNQDQFPVVITSLRYITPVELQKPKLRAAFKERYCVTDVQTAKFQKFWPASNRLGEASSQGLKTLAKDLPSGELKEQLLQLAHIVGYPSLISPTRGKGFGER
jgi:hypothetical protein